MMMPRFLLPISLVALLVGAVLFSRAKNGGAAGDSEVTVYEHTHRDAFTNPYWPTIDTPKLTTPQWIGEEGVEAAAVLSIDDMRGVEPYQSFLEPILQQLEKIDGRAPLSIFTNQIDPNEPQLQRWLKRGVSIEVHTIDHPCPLLKDGDFEQSKKTVHQCLDLLDGIPNMRPVSYRMPCCDSMNSVSPRFYDDIMGPLTPTGNILTSDSSVFQIFTADDPELPRELFANGNEKRFERYVPLGKDFVGTIENYPYPYLIGKQHWQFPCTVPSDWEAQYLQGKNNPRTVEDLKAALDATVAKQGLFVFVFHPHGWIENSQVVELVEYADATYGNKLKFLNMREVQERIDQNMLDRHPIRQLEGGKFSGTQIADVNGDGYMDVKIHSTAARIWQPESRTWVSRSFSKLVEKEFAKPEGDFQVEEALRLWDLDADGDLDAVYSDAERFVIYERDKSAWNLLRDGKHNALPNAPPPFFRADGSNNGVWMDKKTFIIQNEDTSGEPNVIRRVNFADVLAEEDEREGDEDLLSLKPLSPQEGLASMKTKEGLEVQLMAHEPDVMDPIDIAWGADGKLWVLEMADYPEGDEGGRVRFLEDSDQDGRYEVSNLFLEGIPFPTALMAWRKGALVLSAPDLFYAEDTDGDGKADTREVLYTGFAEGNQQHRVNSLRWGLDNWIYLANGDSGGKLRSIKTGQTLTLGSYDLRIRPAEGLLELVSGTTQHGRNRNDAGDWFGNNNSNPLWHYVLDQSVLARNPHFSPPSPIVHMPEVPGNSPVFPTSVTHERFNDFHTANCITSACSTVIYRGELLGDQYYGDAFISEPVHNMVHRQVVSENGVTFTSKRAEDEQNSEFLTSTDPWCRPVSVRTGPDGSLWVVDMYRHVIEHPEWIPHDWETQLDLRAGHERGRLYRVAPKGHAPLPAPDLTKLSLADLVARLGDPSGAVRDLTQQLLTDRKPEGAEEMLAEACRATDWRHRLHALATLDGLGPVSRPVVADALTDSHPAVRRLALRLAGKLKGEWQFPENESDSKVVLEKAITLGEFEGQGRALAELALSSEDQYIRAACVSSMLADTDGFLDRLTESTFEESHSQLLGWVMATSGKRRIAKRLGESNELEAWRLKLIATALPELSGEVEPMLDAAWAMVQDRAAETDLRSVGLEFVCAAETEIQDVSELAALCKPAEPVAFQMTVVRMIGAHFPKAIPTWLIPTWPSLEPALRREVTNWLSSRPSVALSVATQLPNQGVSDLQRSLGQHPAEEVREVIRVLSGSDQDTDKQALKESVLALEGRSERGQAMFQESCAICHVLNGEGNAIGPDLATLTNPSPAFLLEAILDPNAAVEDKYLAYTAETHDGASTIGLLEGESGMSLRFRLANGDQQDFLRRDVAKVVSTGRSLMPEGLEAGRSPQELADLIAYVRAAKPPRKSFAFNEPALVTPDASNTIALLATKASVHGPSLTFGSRYLHLENWCHVQDQAVWTFRCDQPGRYAVTLDYSCANNSAGGSLALHLGKQRQTHVVTGTGNWNGFRATAAGEFDLQKGEHQLVARSSGPINGFLADLRTVTLSPR